MPAPGEKIQCPHCNRDSVAKTERVMDGWTLVGERLVCALCGEPLPDAEGHTETAAAGAELGALARLLGETPEQKTRLAADAGAHFCKDCVHFLRHPFVSRCLYHDRPTEPMDDCPDFSPRPSDEPLGEVNE
jgi:hypothetical protein